MRIEYNGAYLEYRYGMGEVCEIADIHVPADFRCQGVGRKLVEELFQRCKRDNINTVYAVTRADNQIAQQFYEKLQFRVSILWEFYDPHCRKIDALLYSRTPKGPV